MKQETGRRALIDAVLLEAIEQANTDHAVFPEHEVERVSLTEGLAVLGYYDYLMAVPGGQPSVAKSELQTGEAQPARGSVPFVTVQATRSTPYDEGKMQAIAKCCAASRQASGKPGSGCLTDGFQWRFFFCKVGVVYESVTYLFRYDDEESQRRVISVIARMLAGTPEEWLQAPADTAANRSSAAHADALASW
eukprot:TRINITY_DN1281_c0_g1_i3.p2 TRINITY_DN1281_c0_g1~~TRINITY_DN1281_c0_g1_i3.p2  ORF type:complete len:193 (-),score=30.93 TRINITY_DN1281_c0_g1_i3:1457-2035(-)